MSLYTSIKGTTRNRILPVNSATYFRISINNIGIHQIHLNVIKHAAYIFMTFSYLENSEVSMKIQSAIQKDFLELDWLGGAACSVCH